MKKEWILSSLLIVLTLAVCLVLLRSFAPQLIGIPIDLRMVRVAEEVPPFFEHVFNQEVFASKDFVIPDPYVKRGVPLYPDLWSIGPNDLLGFRNRHIPNVADVVTIGDSQTYGNNAPIDLNWPGHMQGLLGQPAEVYNLSVGGWGAVEYMEIFLKARYLKPRVAVIAYYTGNDSLDSFRMAYSSERWSFLRPDPDISAGDAPKIQFPAPDSEHWSVSFPDGVRTVFTPNLRFGANQKHPAVDAGYAIMAKVAEIVAGAEVAGDIRLIFTIIPTKELVYARKIKESGIETREEYERLIRAESERIRELENKLRHLSGAHYVDVLTPLQKAALTAQQIYLDDDNGHPTAEGYRVIAEAIFPVVSSSIPSPLEEGLVAIPLSPGRYEINLIRDGKRWRFASNDLIEKNGWDISHAVSSVKRAVVHLQWGGIIDRVDRERFGPLRD